MSDPTDPRPVVITGIRIGIGDMANLLVVLVIAVVLIGLALAAVFAGGLLLLQALDLV